MYRRGILLLIPPKRRERAGEVLAAIGAVLRKWLVTQLIAMVTLGVVTTVALLLLHVKAAFALGLLSGLFEFIPTVGPIISSLPAIAMGFLDSPEKALWVMLVYVGVHFMESHLLIPLLMKGGIDLPPALTIVTQALMALLFGLLGLMCAVPLLAATVVAVKMLYVQRTTSPTRRYRPHDQAAHDRGTVVRRRIGDHSARRAVSARSRPSRAFARPLSHARSRRCARCRRDLWIKRDDLCADPIGGNKVRALEFLLGDRGARRPRRDRRRRPARRTRSPSRRMANGSAPTSWWAAGSRR